MRTARTGIDYDALVKDDRVHGRVYTDPDIFEEEMDEIFSRGWVYVGHAGEIPNPGDFRVRPIGRQYLGTSGNSIALRHMHLEKGHPELPINKA